MKKTLSRTLHSTLLCVLATLSVSAAPLKVGVSAPLTGDLAANGDAVRNGIVLARELLQPESSDVRFVFQDNKYDPKLAISAFRHHVDIEKVDVIYEWGEPTLYAVAPLAEREGIPVMSMSLDPLPANGKSFSTLSINPAEDYAATLVTYLRSQNRKRFVIVAAEDPFIKAMVEGFRKQLKEDESLVVLDTVLPTETDFRSLYTSLQRHQYDALGVYLLPGQIGTFIRQIPTMNKDSMLFGTDCFESTEEIKSAGPRMIGSVYVQIDVPSWFHRVYRKRFDSDSHVSFAYNAYVFANVAIELSKQGMRGHDLVKTLRELTNDELKFASAELRGQKYWKFPLVVKKVGPVI